MQKLRPCCVCGNMRVYGINILNQWICGECEKNLLKIEGTHIFYDYYIEEVKNIWENYYLLKGRNELV